MGTQTVYKSYQQLEDEDTERYLKKQADIIERRKARIEAEGHKCTVWKDVARHSRTYFY